MEERVLALEVELALERSTRASEIISPASLHSTSSASSSTRSRTTTSTRLPDEVGTDGRPVISTAIGAEPNNNSSHTNASDWFAVYTRTDDKYVLVLSSFYLFLWIYIFTILR
jgi:hypothetical protein